jgi:superfamily II DNA/RNA helicase
MTVPPPLERVVYPLATSAWRAAARPAGLRALMEAEALTTDMHGVQTTPEDERTMPDGIEDNQAEPEAIPQTFRDLGVAEPICAALEAAGIRQAFPIQALALPIALNGHDLIGQARTGTGKTLAFGVALLQRLDETPGGQRSAPRSLVVVPTRELAIQVGDDLRLAGSHLGARVVTLYGGRAYEPQIEALATVDLVVGTPGRLLDLVRQGHLDLSRVTGLVLDEADKMLDLGFLPDVEKILRLTPPHRQTMLFSATMPGEVVTLARRHLRRPTHVRAEHHDEPAHVPSTEQHVFRAHQMDKIEVLARILQAEGRGLTIVFCRTKRACDQLATALTTRGFAAAAVHGDLGQSQRERAMRAFRSGKVDVLVATDVAARGLDVDDVTHVVNYECPEDDNAYLHRTGRTGRAGRTGVAVTFVDWPDLQRWKLIDAALGLGRPEPEETYSTSAHLYSALRIPPEATGTLPAAKRGRLGLEAEDLEDIGETGKNRSRTTRATTRDAGARNRGSRGDSARGRETGQLRKRVRRRTRAGVATAEGHGELQHEPTAAPAHGGAADETAETAQGRHQPARRRRRPSRRRSGRGGATGAAGAAGQTEAAGAAGAAGPATGTSATESPAGEG